MNQFDGNKSVFKARRGAPRDAFASGKRRGAALGADLTHRRPGAFAPWASSHAFADANASPCGALLATGQNHPGQMVHICSEML
jgi:hypothetical protein